MLSKKSTISVAKTDDAVDRLNKDLVLLQTPDMERACLICVLNKPDLMADAEVELQESDFFVPHHKILYGILGRLFKLYVQKKSLLSFDVTTILDQINLLGIENEYLKTQGYQYIDSLKAAGSLTDLENFEYYIKMVKEFSTKRKLYLETCRIQLGLRNDLDRSVDEFLIEAENRLTELHIKNALLANKTIQLGEGLRKFIEETIANPKDLAGITTGFQQLDQSLLGLRRESLTIIGAKYKSGKTALLMNIGLKIASRNIPVYMISTEMSDQEIQIRSVANLAGVRIGKVETGQYSDEERSRVESATTQIEQLMFDHVHVLDYSPERIVSLIRRFVYQKVGFDDAGLTKDCVVLFDYLKMPDAGLKSEWAEKEWQQLGIFASILKNVASQLKIPVITAAQLNEQGGFARASAMKWFGSEILHWQRYEDELTKDDLKLMDPTRYKGVFKLRILDARHVQRNHDGLIFRFDEPLMRIWEDPSAIPKVEKNNEHEY